MEFRLKGYIFSNYFKLLKILQKNILVALFFYSKNMLLIIIKKTCFSQIKKVHEQEKNNLCSNFFSSEFKFLPCIQISFLIMKQLNKNKF